MAPADTDWDLIQRQVSGLGQAALPEIVRLAKEQGIELPPQVEEPDYHLTSGLARDVLMLACAHFFPAFGPDETDRKALLRKIIDGVNVEGAEVKIACNQ